MERMPPLRALFIFSAVGRLENMAKAAAELGISPGAVSQQIKSLETALGVTLVVRRASGIALTRAGRIYYNAISRIFVDLDRVTRELTARQSGDLLVSALPLFASRWLSSRLFEWQGGNSQAQIHLEAVGPEPDAAADAVDFRITYLNRAIQFRSSIPLFWDSLIPVCSPKLLENGPPLLEPSDLLSYRLLTIDWKPLVHPPPTWEDWFREAKAAIFETPKPFIFSLSSLAIEAAIEGRGVTLAQVTMVADDLKFGRLIAPFPQTLRLPSPYCLAWNETVFDKLGARDFQRWLIGVARRDGPRLAL